MDLPFFSLFQKKTVTLSALESQLINNLKSYATNTQTTFLNEVSLFHQKDHLRIPALLFDKERGLYIFEKKSWNFQELKNAKVESNKQNPKKESSLKIEESDDFVTMKFNDILHNDGCQSTHILLLEHLSKNDYENLDPSFAALIPENRVLFSDENDETIALKLSEALDISEEILDEKEMISTLISHEVIIDDETKEISLPTLEQREFIETPLQNNSLLIAPYGSGKSTTLLLKALYHILLDREEKIIIIQNSQYGVDKLKSQLLDIIEFGLIDIDFERLEIITDQQLMQKHYMKLYKKPYKMGHLPTDKMLSKSYKAAPLIFCDDAELHSQDFLQYLKHIQKNELLLLSTALNESMNYTTYHLEKSFRCSKDLLNLLKNYYNYTFEEQFQATPYAEDIQITQGNEIILTLLSAKRVLKESKQKDLLIVMPDEKSVEIIQEELNEYLGNIASSIDMQESSLYQNFTGVIVTQISKLSSIQRDHVIVSGVDNEMLMYELSYAISRGKKSTHIILTQECDKENFFNKTKREHDAKN